MKCLIPVLNYGLFSKITIFLDVPLSEANATAILLNKFDNLFDSLNTDSQNLRIGKKYSTNMTNNSSHRHLFIYMRKFNNEINFIGTNSTLHHKMARLERFTLSKKFYSITPYFQVA